MLNDFVSVHALQPRLNPPPSISQFSTFNFQFETPLFPLIYMLIFLTQLQQPFELLHPFQLHLPCIHQFPIRLHPVEHIVLLNSMARRITMISLDETLHLIVSFLPFFGLGHFSN